jgi:hypothetical protein
VGEVGLEGGEEVVIGQVAARSRGRMSDLLERTWYADEYSGDFQVLGHLNLPGLPNPRSPEQSLSPPFLDQKIYLKL